MQKISAVIITLNEEKYIGQCLESLQQVVDEILVVDSYSKDKTKEICQSYKAKFIEHEFEGYKEQKNWAMKQASNDIILSLDGDELLSEELQKSILRIKEDFQADGYTINRRNNYYGRWMKHSGVYPDRRIRLFNRQKGEWKGINPHDIFRLNNGANKQWLKGDLLHYVNDSMEKHRQKIENFSNINAREYIKLGKKSGIIKIIIHPFWRFFKSYFLKLGFLEGQYGLTVCYMNAYSSYRKHIKIRQLGRLS